VARSNPLVFVCGFGAFERVRRNPSGEIVRALAADPPSGLRVEARVLPVSFERAPREWDRFLKDKRRPALCLGLGVAKKPGFRLERFGRPTLKCIQRADVDGRLPAEFSRPGPALETGIDLPGLCSALRARGPVRVRVSRTAGGYVCERICHHLLMRSESLGSQGLFIHVPPLRFTRLHRQVEFVRWVLEELLAPRRGHSSSNKRG
jgi:pyrrolidone-carboxylate peptidase